jgi:hypothetical protein
MMVFFDCEKVDGVVASDPAILLLRRGGSFGGGPFILLLLILGTGSSVPTDLEILVMNCS